MAFKLRHKRSGQFLGKSTLRWRLNSRGRWSTNMHPRGGTIFENSVKVSTVGECYSLYNDEDGNRVKFDEKDFEKVEV